MTWICSLRPDVALMVLSGEPTVLLAPPELEKCRGKLAIHAGTCETQNDRDDCWDRIFELGWSPEDMPEGALVGWAKVSKVIRYDNNTFMTDYNKHCYSSPSLQQFKDDNEWLDDVYGLYLEEVHILKVPIEGIGKDKAHGSWWEPEIPLDTIGLKTLFEAESVEIDSVLPKV